MNLKSIHIFQTIDPISVTTGITEQIQEALQENHPINNILAPSYKLTFQKKKSKENILTLNVGRYFGPRY